MQAMNPGCARLMKRLGAQRDDITDHGSTKRKLRLPETALLFGASNKAMGMRIWTHPYRARSDVFHHRAALPGRGQGKQRTYIIPFDLRETRKGMKTHFRPFSLLFAFPHQNSGASRVAANRKIVFPPAIQGPGRLGLPSRLQPASPPGAAIRTYTFKVWFHQCDGAQYS